MTSPTDMTILRALLDAGKSHLTTLEEKAFRNMLSDLANGVLVRLSKAQRAWVEQKYYHLNLDKAYKNKAPPQINLPKVGPPKSVYAWEENRPLKPPGRK